ncbi:MAG: hypothetical protein GWN13_03445, partial [Phycisphaerae bacterium]|nr:hypothetical protein [Phycisphaerae bacterium]
YAYFRSVNEAKEKISLWNIDTETIDYEEWNLQGLKNFLGFLADGNILLIRPWPKKFALRGPYAGAVQFFNNFEDAKDQWGLQNFSTLNRRVETMERRLRTRELRKKFIS